MPKTKTSKRKLRHRRVRGRVSGTPQRPRLFVFKSNRHIYCGLADDTSGHILLSYSDMKLGKDAKNTKDTAQKVGEELAKLAVKEGYRKVVFDRSGYRYHGKVKALADGARSQGLAF